MTDKAPTYRLDNDFRSKLDHFDGTTVEETLTYFSEEFAGIDEYHQTALADRSTRDDHDLRRTPIEDYAREFLAFRDLDRQNRAAFNATEKTLIIMPDCLSIHDTPCEKVDHKRGDICKRCLPDCQAKEISDLTARYRARALFSKRKLEDQLKYHRKSQGDTGVIGVACILMLAEGMRTADGVGVPARGVPLMFCGCEHWNDLPFTSVFSLPWLESLLEEKYGRQH